MIARTYTLEPVPGQIVVRDLAVNLKARGV